MSVVGIDLGTTNTVVACVKNGRVHVLADEQGRRLLPSVVSFHPNGEVLVGAAAKQRRMIDARNTIASVKRLLGRPWSSPELEKARRRAAFEMKEGPGQGPLVVARGKELTLPEISAFILRRVREIAETALKEPVERAVITVPAHFNELQRAATKVAGKVAGLEVLRILNEPTAAALAYGLGKGSKERIAVYDFGGGTFDATLLDLNGNVFEVLATAGDPFLGGDDVDDAIAERMADAFLLQHRFDPRSDPQAQERLRQAAEQLKIALTTQEQAQVHLREIAFGAFGAHLDLTFGLTRSELEKMMDPLVERTFRVTQDALNLARLAPSAFDRTILVGGTSRVPLVRRRVEAFFGSPPMDRMNPEEVVAIGAAIQAAALTDASRRRSIPPPPAGALPRTSIPSFAEFNEAAPPSSRASQPVIPDVDDDSDTEALDRRMLAPLAPETSPSTQRGVAPMAAPVQTTTARMPTPPPLERTAPMAQQIVRIPSPPPPSPAAPTRTPIPPGPGSSAPPPPVGQHYQSQPPAPPVFTSTAPPPVLIDVTPRALVVETVGGYCDVIIPRNAKIPCERTRIFSTAQDGQSHVRVRVAQGEEASFRANTFLGEVELTGIRMAPRGEVTVAVTFELDADGSLQVRAADTATGAAAAARLHLAGIAGDGEIAAMQRRMQGAGRIVAG